MKHPSVMKALARHSFLAAGSMLALWLAVMPENARGATRPNVLLILTDDQGHGDLGFHQNPKIRTPSMDRLANEGVRFDRFHVSPVCSPTRSSLMTGRYCYRTGIVDTFLGRSMMFPDEVTIARMLADAGYRTGIFGKWHLGDTYPMRAMDKGFQESLTLNGGGLAQAADPPLPVNPKGAYFDPWLSHNGHWVRKPGYVTDVLTDAALDFISAPSDKPFFVYLAYNAPHVPLQVPDKYYARYKDADLTVPQSVGHPVGKWDHETTARIYAMVECIDDNLGRLLARLDQLKIADNTVVIFLSDNGPQQPRYNSGLLDLKGNTHEGGVRVPFFVRWPGHFQAGRAVSRIAAHIDVTPTLLELCAASPPPGLHLDGLSLVPLLEGRNVSWPDRTLYFQWHRGDVPELNRACAAIAQNYKLVQPRGAIEKGPAYEPIFELYDYAADPLEMTNIAAANPAVLARMRRGYEDWFKDVTGTRDFSVPPRIWLGASEQPLVLLTRQDWRGPAAGWAPESIGGWFVDVRRAGDYALTVRFAKAKQPALLKVGLGSVNSQQAVAAGDRTAVLPKLRFPQGLAQLEAVLDSAERRTGVEYIEVKYIDASP